MTPELEQGLAILAQLGAAIDNASAAAPGPPSEALPHVAEARYRALIEQIPAVTFMASLDGGLNEVYVSPQIEGLLGFAQEEWMSNPVLWFRQLHPDDIELWNKEFARGCSTGGPFRAECRFIARDGSVVWVHGEARQFLRESQDRIRSMALVHEMLYRSQDLARIDFGEYARSLVQQLLRSYSVDVRQLKHAIDIEHTLLGVDEAVPCGLIINELVANSLKHAFPANRGGRIWVRMEADEHRCTLRVGDDGVGFSKELDFQQTETLGLQLVRTLTDQLGGVISLSREAGTEFTVSFPRRAAVA